MFCKRNGVIPVTSAPTHSRMNGMTERVIQTFKKRYLATKDKITNSEHCLQPVLFTFHQTPPVSTNRSSADLCLGRKIESVLE